MGGCFSDLEGGKQAVGGLHQRQYERSTTNSNAAHNDAVHFFYKTKGFQPVFTQVELSLSASNLIGILHQRFHVYDVDTKYHGVLTKIVTKHRRSLTLRLQNKSGNGGSSRNLGAFIIHAEETVASRTVVEMILRCSHLDNKDIFFKTDPFLRISRVVESGGSVPVCRTEVIDINLNPAWKPVSLSSHQFGSKILKGQLFVDQYSEKEQFSFIDYISSRFELNFMVAVDFTASNGNPRSPSSLHYIDPSGQLNSYQKCCLMEVI